MLRSAGEHGMGQEEDDWLEAVSASDCVSTGRGVSSPLWHCVPLAHLVSDICLSSAFLLVLCSASSVPQPVFTNPSRGLLLVKSA